MAVFSTATTEAMQMSHGRGFNPFRYPAACASEA